MPTPKKVPVEVALRASALTKQYTVARPSPTPEPKPKPARDKVVAALKKLHPMD